MRAKRQPGLAEIAARTSAIGGQRLIAGACKSFSNAARSAAMAAALSQASGRLARSENPPARARNTAGVAKASRGFASKSPKRGRLGAALNTSPTPSIRAGREPTQTGTSAPSVAPIAAKRVSGQSSPQSRLSARRLAAASALPPPIPLATGRRFNRCSSAWSSSPASVASALAARSTRLSGSAASAPLSAPSMARDNISPDLALTVSSMPANTTRLSSRWYPSARRPVTCRKRLTLAGAGSEIFSAASPRLVGRQGHWQLWLRSSAPHRPLAPASGRGAIETALPAGGPAPNRHRPDGH